MAEPPEKIEGTDGPDAAIDSDPHSTEETSDPKNSPPAVQIPQPTSALAQQPPPDTTLGEVERELNRFERSTLRWTRATFGVVLATGLFICLQWCEMHSGSVDTGKLVEAAKRQASANVQQVSNFAALALAAKAESEAAGKQANSMKDFADRMKDQADRTKVIAEQAERSSKIAERTLRIFETQQRAWVALATPPTLEPAKNGVIWAPRNFGSSTAFHVAHKGESIDRPGDIVAAQEKICRELETSQMWEVLFPGTPGRPRAAFSIGAPIVYLVGCIRYRDQFSTNRWTKFCYEFDGRDSNSFITCLGYNSTDADDDKKPSPPN